MEWYSMKGMKVDDEKYGVEFQAGWDEASEVSVSMFCHHRWTEVLMEGRRVCLWGWKGSSSMSG